ncbi:MAG: hypothetical protein AAGI50_09330 [Pseudomonadota bacterium]
MDQLVSLGFVACAAVAMFVCLNVEGIREDGLKTVIVSYVS